MEQFPKQQQERNPVQDRWLELVDSSLGEHEAAVREIITHAPSARAAISRLSDYMHKEEVVSEVTARDNAVKLGTEMPPFRSDDDGVEEVFWNLYVQLRSDQYSGW